MHHQLPTFSSTISCTRTPQLKISIVMTVHVVLHPCDRSSGLKAPAGDYPCIPRPTCFDPRQVDV
eukprot:4271235-Pyramimonas_sp.AAC.1